MSSDIQHTKKNKSTDLLFPQRAIQYKQTIHMVETLFLKKRAQLYNSSTFYLCLRITYKVEKDIQISAIIILLLPPHKFQAGSKYKIKLLSTLVNFFF